MPSSSSLSSWSPFRVVLASLLVVTAAACSDCGPVGPGEGEGEGEGEAGEGEGEGGEGEGGEGEGEGEPVERVVCEGAPTANPGADVCAVTNGAGGLVVVGDLLVPGTIFVGGGVAIDEDGTISCVGCDCAAQNTGRTLVVCPDAVVSPGLINPHDHAGWMNERPWVAADEGVDPQLRWEHRHDWRRGRRGHPEIDAQGQANTEAKALGEFRFSLGGATATLASGGFDDAAGGVLRNLDDEDDAGDIGAPFVDYETFPLDDSDGTQLESGCGYGDIRDAPGFAPYAPHISEGIDQVAHNEFTCLSSTSDGGKDVIGANTAIIHGVGLLPQDVALMAQRQASLIWSPRSNVSLYGDTAQVPIFLRLGVNVALGTDWIPSGSLNMLRELRCASDLNENHWNNDISDEQLWRMVTVNGAQALGATGALGALVVGARGDIAVFAKNGRDDFRAVVDATSAEVALVLKDGLPLNGNAAVVDALDAGCDELDVCGVAKKVCAERETGSSLAALQAAANGAGYDLFSCDETPSDEPTCVPARPLPADVVNDSTPYAGGVVGDDGDGDGIINGDNCATHFNPARPLDNGAQSDVDADGVGDVCDPCPLDADTTECATFNADDKDSDGVDNLDDNCPDDANADQADADGDQRGDVCDACPADANPGDVGCPASVYELKSAAPADVDGRRVSVPGLVVTAVAANGFFAQANPDAPDYAGVENSCIFTFVATGGTLPAVGDLIDVTGATVSDFFTQIQLSGATFDVVDAGIEVPPHVLSAADVTAAVAAEARSPFESCLVEVRDVAVTDATPTGGPGDPTAANELELAGGLRLDDFIFLLAPLPTEGEVLTVVRGVLPFKNGLLKLLPRSIDDVVFGDTALAAVEPALSFVRTNASNATTFPDAVEVRLTRAADTAVTVLLSSSDAAVTVPATIEVPAGALSVVVPVTTGAAEGTATLSARLDAADAPLTAQVRVLAPAATANIATIAPTAATLAFGAAQVFTVTTDIPAPVGGQQFDIAIAPATLGTAGAANVTVAQNATSATFTFTAGNTATSGTVTVDGVSADVDVVDPGALDVDLSGFKLVQTDAGVTVTLPAGTSVAVGGFLIVARNVERAAFEAVYGALPATVTYLNGKNLDGGNANGFPVINGDETFTLQDAANVAIDGPTISINTGASYHRSAPDADASLATSWTEAGNAPNAGPTPGAAPAGTNGGCYISEIVDAAAFANEYIEIRCDATTP